VLLGCVLVGKPLNNLLMKRDLQCKSKKAFISPTGACTNQLSSCEMNCAIGSTCYRLNGFFIGLSLVILTH
jgi:hypothetical protein